eukprot:TRINITY_DN2106_c0_g1_i2.p1 TRINITY_DN2106_c0_g1~~TRINITY_DN2106_c0_g1_i2.p1  ORF type:complete len:371 (-),score=98.45 TRINITY_DN2106_c0_g1_i2:131-1243(-)
MPSEEGSPHKNRPENSAYKQQRIRAWQLILRERWVIGAFMLFGVLFLGTGAGIFAASTTAKEYKVQYDGVGTSPAILSDCGISTTNEDKTCTVTISVKDKMEAPVYVYYQLDNFYQSHRRYVASLSPSQLMGSNVQGDSLCSPLKKNGDQWLNPCGLVANSMFNDVFTVSTAPAPFDATAPAAYMRETGIAWPNDIDRFSQPDGFVKKSCGGNAACTSCLGAGYTDCGVATDADGKRWAYYYPNDATTQYLHETYPKVVSPLEGVTNEHFMVWMRTAALPTFRKLYGIIDSDIPGGWDVQFDINANFLVANFNGKKSIVLASSVGVGGFNGALGIAYLVIGGVLLLVGLLLLAKVLLKPRPLGFAALHQD